MATNYSEYSKWKAVTLPTGGVVYKVPDQPGWVYDPVLSAAKGRPVMFIDPSARIDEQNKAKEAADKAQKQQEQANSVWGQVAPTLGNVGGIAGGTALATWLSPSAAAAPAVAAPAVAAPGTAIVGGGGGAAFGGGTAGASGALAAPTGLTATAVPGAGATTATGGALSGAGAALPIAGTALAAFLAGRYQLGVINGDKKMQNSPIGLMGRGILGASTFGGSEAVNYLGKRFGAFGHKSTRQSAADHTNYLMDEAGNDPNAQAYVQGMREQYNTAPVGNAYAGGKYATFDEYKKAGLDAKDLSGVYGNMETFGPQQWANLTQDQREAVTKGLIDADLYKSKKGDIEITDKNQAKQIYDSVLNPKVELNPTTPPPQPAGNVQNLKPPTKVQAEDIKLGTQIAEKFNNRNKKR